MTSNENEHGRLCFFALALNIQYGYLNIIIIIINVIKQWHIMCCWLLLLHFSVFALLQEKVGIFRLRLIIYLRISASFVVPYIWICLSYNHLILNTYLVQVFMRQSFEIIFRGGVLKTVGSCFENNLLGRKPRQIWIGVLLLRRTPCL